MKLAYTTLEHSRNWRLHCPMKYFYCLPLFLGASWLSTAFAGENLIPYINFNVAAGTVNRLQLETRDASLAEVLKTIAKKTQTPIHYSVLPEGLVTSTCIGSSVQQILECLLARQANIVVRTPNPQVHTPAASAKLAQTAEIWILGAKLTSENYGHHASGENSRLNLPPEDANNNSESVQIETLSRMASSPDATERLDAISALAAQGKKDDANVKQILEAALHDSAPSVRASAISSLTLREGTDGTSSALREALHDSSADVRLMATDAIENNVELLTEATYDRDEIIRQLALSKLEDLRKLSK